MKVVILCGGKGTRIREVTEVLPKPMVSIGGMPILWHIMKGFAHYDVKEFVLCLGYKGWEIKEFFLNYRTICHDFTLSLGDNDSTIFHNSIPESDWKVTLADTGEDTMTGARLWRVRKYLEGEDQFCLTYGDGLSDVDFAKLAEFHKKNAKIGTITAVRPSSRFGEISLGESVVTQFNEKPNIGQGWINGGFMMFDNRKIWDYLWPDDNLVLEKDTLPALVKDKQLAAFQHTGFWFGMDTPRERALLDEMWLSEKAPWKVWK